MRKCHLKERKRNRYQISETFAWYELYIFKKHLRIVPILVCGKRNQGQNHVRNNRFATRTHCRDAT